MSTRPAANESEWSVLDLETETVVFGPTTKRKADNHWKKLVNFGNPDSAALRRFVTSFNPEATLTAERMRNELSAARMEGRTPGAEAVQWANESARKLALGQN